MNSLSGHIEALAREETYKQQEWQKITREELINGIRTKPTGGTDKPVRGNTRHETISLVR